MRYSHQRQLVYDALKSTKTHPDATWVYAVVKQQMPRISLGTVYRNLNELCDAGLVKRIAVANSVERYDADVSAHTHLKCNTCGCITDANPVPVELPVTDFQVETIEVVAYGTCKNCASKAH
jgi:Fur family peroxide stress response transcriptional regulator